MSGVTQESPRQQAFEDATRLWGDALGGSFVRDLGITEATESIEGNLAKRGLSEREARVISDWAFRGVIRQENASELESVEREDV